MPWYDLLDKFFRFRGEIDFKESRPQPNEIVVADGVFYRWSVQSHAFVVTESPTNEPITQSIPTTKGKYQKCL